MRLILTTCDDMESQYLVHYRTPGSKNGVRLYQNKDGSLTPLGRIHYGVGLGRDRTVTGGKKGALIGKKQVNSDGTLAKRGIKNVEEASKNGYLNPLNEDRKKGKTEERDKISKMYSEEYWKSVKEGMPTNSPSEKGKELWDKYKDQYAEATLKDLKLPVSEKNKAVVKDTFSKYDPNYEYTGDKDEETQKSYHDEIKRNWEKRFNKSGQSNKEIKEHIEKSIKEFNDKTGAAKKERAEKAAEEKKQRQEAIAEIRSLSDMELNKRIERLQKERTLAELINARANYEQSPLKAKAAKIFKQFAENFANKALNQAGDEVLRKLMNKGKTGDSKSSGDSSKSKGSDSGTKFSKPEKDKIRSMAAAGKSVTDIATALGTTEDRVKGFIASAGLSTSS